AVDALRAIVVVPLRALVAHVAGVALLLGRLALALLAPVALEGERLLHVRGDHRALARARLVRGLQLGERDAAALVGGLHRRQIGEELAPRGRHVRRDGLAAHDRAIDRVPERERHRARGIDLAALAAR